MKKLEDFSNGDLLELYTDMVKEYHYSPCESKTFEYRFNDVENEILRRMEAGEKGI